jgi:predicted aspartyl protease
MRAVWAAAALALFLSAGAVPGYAADERDKPDIESANNLFKAGQFAQAATRYARVAASDPRDYQAAVRLGEIALLANRLDEARKWLEKALAIRPDAAQAKEFLGEVFYRRDEFLKAAPLFRAAGKKGRASKLASFKDLTPYEVKGPGQSTRVKFVQTEPLPLVHVRVNGGKEVVFFLDTGASEVFLDGEFARELGIKQFGVEEGTFAGGKKASGAHGRIDSLKLGDWDIKNVPVGILNLRPLSKLLGGKRIDGVLGTVLFYHFLTTLDYPKGELVLRRKTADNLRQLEKAQAGKAVAVPFWMAGDHYMVAWGRIAKGPSVLFFVDTGLAGAGVNLGEDDIKAAGIKLDRARAFEAVGAGGKYKAIPFTVGEMSLGGARERNVKGLNEGRLQLENTFGFRLAGVVGHEFFRPYALTFDFSGMRLLLERQAAGRR